MSAFTVHQYGEDAYGRPVFMTEFMHDWYEDYCDELGWRPRILQGCYMERIPGGGAAASEGAHDKAKCLDLETEGRTTAEVDGMVKVARTRGGGAYRRDETWRHGSMRKHMHVTVGADAPGSPMAEILWQSYVAGGDGLAIQPSQPDYEWRPIPLILTPPKDWFDMATKADLKAAIREVLAEDGLVEAPADDAAFSGGSTSVVGALKRIWNLAPKGK
jgi:hypothetical protein